MKTKLMAISSLLIAGALAAPIILAEDSDADRSHPKAFVKDSVITTKIKSKLAAEHITSLAHIKVDTDKNGVVSLSGTARSQEAINKAGEIARSVEGVASVNNDITVKADD
jgi:hyperosmotically inducible periplasmic protein